MQNNTKHHYWIAYFSVSAEYHNFWKSKLVNFQYVSKSIFCVTNDLISKPSHYYFPFWKNKKGS